MEIRIKITVVTVVFVPLGQQFAFSIVVECLYGAEYLVPFAQITFTAKCTVLGNIISCQQKPNFKKLFPVFKRL